MYYPFAELHNVGPPTALTDFEDLTGIWTSYAFFATVEGAPQFCVAGVPKQQSMLTKLTAALPQFGVKSPSCAPLSAGVVRAGYVGEAGGPLPPRIAVYLVDPAVRELRLFDAGGGMSLARGDAKLEMDRVFFASVSPGSPPVRFQVSRGPGPPAGR
ncbi:hypothetical protein [Amycolatopsis sp. NPDC004625]|uniref:hypothetical protein n=1 Tax=Amycolatopsis sp. NPDC004625 TaxID=3154670 RepID=UPI0033B8B518